MSQKGEVKQLVWGLGAREAEVKVNKAEAE
jgi:hypothetical protein